MNNFFITGILVFTISGCTLRNPDIIIYNEPVNDVNHMLFGQFMEKCSWGGEIGGDLVIDTLTGEPVPEILELMKSMKIPVMRYPGGTDVDYYPWYDLVENVPFRESAAMPPYRNRHSKKIVSDNRLGLDRFLELCKTLNSEPLLVINMGDAFFNRVSIDSAARVAAGFVAYCNGIPSELPEHLRFWAELRIKNGFEKPFNVTYFEIGNEPWLFKGINMQTEENEPVIDHYLDCLEAIANAVLEVDSSVKLITDGGIMAVSAKMEDRLGDKISYLAYHPYVPWAIKVIYDKDSNEVDMANLSAKDIWNAWCATPNINDSTGLADFVVDNYYKNVYQTNYNIALTEWNWNGWFEGDVKDKAMIESRFNKAVGAAGFLHAMIRSGDRMKIGCQSMLIGQSWDISGIRYKPGEVDNPIIFPTAQITKMYSLYHGNENLQVEVVNPEYYAQPYFMNGIKPHDKVALLDVVATQTDSLLFIHIINRSFDQGKDVNINVEAFNLKQDGKHHMFYGELENSLEHEMANIDTYPVEVFRKNIHVHLPERTVSILEFTKGN